MLKGASLRFSPAAAHVWRFSRVTTVKSESLSCGPRDVSLHSSCKGELGIALESLQGKEPSSRLVSRNSMFLSSGDKDLVGLIQGSPGESGLVSS